MPWNKNDYPQTLLEAVAAHSFFCTLGYSTGDLFLCLNPGFVGVRLQSGGLDFVLPIGKPELPLRKMRKAWLKLIAEWNLGGSITNRDKDEICYSSKVFGREAEIVADMVVCGLAQRRLKPPPDWWSRHSLN